MLNFQTNNIGSTDRPLLDRREKKYAALSLDNVFYVVHLISQGDKTWYRDALIASDTGDELLNALSDIEHDVANEISHKGEINNIKKPESLLVHPIFIRNLNADSKELVEASEVTKISQELSSLINTDPDLMRYVVLGFASAKDRADELILTDVQASNAVIAINRVASAVKEQIGREFRPLFSTIKAPVTSEMFTRYNLASKNIRDFVTATPTFGKILH